MVVVEVVHPRGEVGVVHHPITAVEALMEAPRLTENHQKELAVLEYLVKL